MAEQMGVDLIEHEGALFAYPALVRVHPKDMAVTIDRVRETRLRPSHLIKRLKYLQTRPYRFKPHEFLAILYAALQKNQTVVTIGWQGKLSSLLTKWVPKKILMKETSRKTRPPSK